MIVFLAKVVLVAVLVLCMVAVAAATVFLWYLCKEKIEEIRGEEERNYNRGYARGKAEGLKYPMGIYTFPVACANCRNIRSNKCYRCKEEIMSGFELKPLVEEETR